MPSVGMSPGDVEIVSEVPFDAGVGAPTDGMSPAKAEEKRAHVRAIVIRNRFMEVSLCAGINRQVVVNERVIR